jgi:hypothetical protein
MVKLPRVQFRDISNAARTTKTFLHPNFARLGSTYSILEHKHPVSGAEDIPVISCKVTPFPRCLPGPLDYPLVRDFAAGRKLVYNDHCDCSDDFPLTASTHARPTASTQGDRET